MTSIVQIKTYQHNYLLLWSSILCMIGLLLGCAEPKAPEGGPRDERYPRLHKKKYSTPSPSTNFQDNQVILTFDEWVKLKAAYSQVIISPPLEERPTIKIRNKSVVVKWKEALKDSTTYIINFGESVQDITEGNIVPNLKMVFSTGPYLDSLSCSGQIVDAKNRKPKEEVLVMLYRNLEDSIPRTQKPYYFTKTDKQGAFKIEYLKSGRYRIFALEDKNQDYKYNLNNESIAFLDSTFLINDTLQPVLRLSMFKEREATTVFSKRLETYGRLKITFNNSVQTESSIRLLDPPSDFKMLVEQGGDSLRLWFDGTMDSIGKWRFVVENEAEDLIDTIQVTAKSKSVYKQIVTGLRWYKKQEKAIEDPNSRSGPAAAPAMLPLQDSIAMEQHPFEPIELDFIRPIMSWDSSQFLFYKDTLMMVVKTTITERLDSLTEEVIMDTIQQKALQDTFVLINRPQITKDGKLMLSVNWEPSARYQLKILPGGVTDFFDFSNVDTLSRIYSINEEEVYGSLTAIIKGADSTVQYLVQLTNSVGNIVEETVVRDSSQIRLVYLNIAKNTYTIRVVHDELPNERWDVGNYDEKRQAEKTTNSKPIQLNSGWENVMEMNLKPVKEERSTRKQIDDVPTPREQKGG